MNYMSRLVAGFALYTATSVFAGPMPSIPKIEGRLAESFEGLKTFNMTSHQLEGCKQTLDQASFKAWECFDNDGADVMFSGPGEANLKMKLAKKYHVHYKSYFSQWIWQFNYSGNMGGEFNDNGIPANTPGSLIWWVDEAKPDVIKVVWSLNDLDISRSFFAAPKQ